jgi:phosphatidylglycerophosphatase A
MIDAGDAKSPRPRTDWRARIGVLLATVFGIGYAPIAPGTWGTVAAIPLVLVSASLTQWGYLALCVAVTGVAIAASGAADRAFGLHDSGRIVIDELVGYFWTMAAIADRAAPVALVTGFVLFRFADILKPPPARAIDNRMKGGAGVVLDDVVAGWWAAAALLALDRTGLLGYMGGP